LTTIPLGCVSKVQLCILPRYITRSDGSPLMDVLSKWRQSTLEHRNQGAVSRSPSPAASAKGDDEEPLSSGDEGTNQVQNARTTSLSWIRWWNRSQRTRASSEKRGAETRPAMPERSSNPPEIKQVESRRFANLR
jgi:hypothetical protein